MARTEKDTVTYFPHDSHASSGDTLTVLQSRWGNNGYAVWFKLLEKIAAADGHYIDCRNPVKWNLLVAQLGVDEITTVEIIKLLVVMGNIDRELWDSRVIWIQKLVDNVAGVYQNRRREVPQKPVITPDNAISTPDNAISTPGNPQSKVNKSKVNNNKAKACEIWLTVKDELREVLSPTNFKTWLENTEGYGIDGELFLVNVPSHHIQDYLIQNQKSTIEAALYRASENKYIFAPVVEKVNQNDAHTGRNL